MKRWWIFGVLLASLHSVTGQAVAEGDPARGKKLFDGFLRCYACHSLKPGVSKVGPSLARLFGRAAATGSGFDRYSDALKRSGVIWDANTLDEFLADPQKFIPGNRMAMDGYFVSDRIDSARIRADVIAYLEQTTHQ